MPSLQDMFVPLINITELPTSNIDNIYRRMGGGGGGGRGSSGGKNGGSSSSSKGKSSSGSSAGRAAKSLPLAGTLPVGKNSATVYGGGGGKVVIIPSGSPFAGRTAGGGTRNQVYGSRTYGSGYPGASGVGVYHRGFPFYFWPLVWYPDDPSRDQGRAYTQDSEYGSPSNSSRPGGAMAQANFISSSFNTEFHLLADNSTVTSLISTIDANCSFFLSSSSSTTAIPYNASDPNAPRAEQAVQYFRASSVVLTLDGYNDTTALSNDTNAADIPLPTNIDTNLLNCLNQTIGLSVPLVDSAGVVGPPVSLFWVFWFLCIAYFTKLAI